MHVKMLLVVDEWTNLFKPPPPNMRVQIRPYALIGIERLKPPQLVSESEISLKNAKS